MHIYIFLLTTLFKAVLTTAVKYLMRFKKLKSKTKIFVLAKYLFYALSPLTLDTLFKNYNFSQVSQCYLYAMAHTFEDK